MEPMELGDLDNAREVSDLMDAGETRGLPDRVLSVRVPKGEEQDRLKVLAEYDRMPDGFMILGKKGGRLTLLALNGMVLHSGQRGWRDGQEAMYEVEGG